MKPLVVLLVVCGLLGLDVFAQRAAAGKASTAAKRTPQKSLIMAVLDDGKVVEPIAYLGTHGKLTHAIDGSSEQKVLTAFHNKYFAKGKTYSLIFGGQTSGTVKVDSSDPRGECVNFIAKVTTKTTRTPLKGNVMALATNATLTKPGSGIRRLPTPAERAEIEGLVRAEFVKNGIAESAVTNLRSHNLTALDVDSDANSELVGTYWVEPSPKDRGLLFFIAQRGDDGKYTFGHSEFRKVNESETMSEDITNVDSGVYHERLLDIFDVDGDGVSEVFSYVMSFEGAGFNVYKRNRTGWSNIFDGSNYHCGY